MSQRAHYPSGEPGTTGREPFEEGTGPKVEAGAYDGLSGAGGDRGTTGEFTTAGQAGDNYGTGTGLTGGHGHSHEHTSTTNTHHGDSYGSRGSGFDKTGHLDQHAHNYEQTGAGGPTSSGAANTDKFDADRQGVTGNSYGATDAYPDLQREETNRKGTGGIGGILGTEDKDFTINPDRTAKGAYNDDHGNFKTNTDGPSGQTALTGREGTTHKNPVAQAQGHTDGHGTAGAQEHEKKGLMEKVKDVLHK